MADPITINGAVQDASEAIAALKRVKPRNEHEARQLTVELLRANELFIDASKTAIGASVEARIANASNNHAPAPATSLVTEEMALAMAKEVGKFVKQQLAEKLA